MKVPSQNPGIPNEKPNLFAASGNISRIAISVHFFYFEGNSRRNPFGSFMTPHRLENYLRSYRKESGLSQQEVAFLLGCEDGTVVSRYEKRRRLPPIDTALACEEIFGVPVGELFVGMRQSVGKDIAKRRLELRSRLQAKTVRGAAAQVAAHKLRWLADREHPVVANQSSSLS
jgi:transcriptional regulator with XRE-family HTH domain